MRVLQLMNRIPWPLNDGGSIGYYNFTKGYADAGCEVTVMSFNTSKHYVANLSNELLNIAKWIQVPIQNEVTIGQAFSNLFTNESYHAIRFKDSGFANELAKLLLENEFDIVVVESIFMMWYESVIRKCSKAKIVLRQHNVEHLIWQRIAANERNIIKRKYLLLQASRLKQFEEKYIKKADAILAITENDAAIFKQLRFDKPIHIAPLGIEMSRYENNEILTKANTFFHLGSMEWQPNIEGVNWLLENVWTQVVMHFPQVQLHLAGRKLNNDFTLPYTTQVTIDGEVKDAISYMHQYQIMLVPIFSGSGIRVKIIEGMAAGKTIITTSLGAQGIPYTHGKNVLIANTAHEFYQCIAQVLNNNELCNVIGKEAQLLAERAFNQANIIKDVMAFYQNLK